MSDNSITGTWSPSAVDNQNSGTYTFTPTAGQCATVTTFTVTVTPNITPTFSFGTSLTICAGGAVPTLPATSDNAITGTWNPSTVDNQNSGTYTFTPTSGGCVIPTTFTVTVTPNITPTFSFGTSLTICAGATVPTLPATSDNAITGTWSPSSVDNQNSGTYTFTPTSGGCVIPTTFTVTVTPNITPIFSFGTSLTICSGTGVPSLPTTSANSITGTWSPSIVDNQNSGTYTFTPTTGQCATATTFAVTVTPTIFPDFSFGSTLTVCINSAVPDLPLTSTNGISGVWSPSTVSNQASAIYTFTPTSTPGQCIATTSFTVTVNALVTPAFSFGTSQTICAGSSVPTLSATSANGITGSWSPATVDNQSSGTYTFTASPGQCATETTTFTVSVNPVGTVSSNTDISVDDGAVIPLKTLSGTPGGVSFTWSNSNTAIGLAASGTGNVPSFTATNLGSSPITGTITVTPKLNGCVGSTKTYIITVKPLDKDVFVPNVFSPNGDGKNDVLLVYGNYISKLEMRIFNQWGEQVELVTSKEKGWDGRHKGKAQPVGVYVYSLQAIMNDGKTIKLKGYITLLR
jgi:gliding motility-associated-like protein